MRCLVRFLGVLAILASTAGAEVLLQGKSYPSWGEYFASEDFLRNQGRCLTPLPPVTGPEKAVPGDCPMGSNIPRAEYAPGRAHYRIPVVFHVITDTQGNGAIAPELIAAQVAVLNEDFRAVAGTPGALGLDTNIEFYLAEEDPLGAPTTGIVTHANDVWFADGDEYWTSTSWDAARYLNIYTNEARGALGYTPLRPAQDNGAKTGTAEDRVVVLWSLVGRPAPAGPPYDQGRTLTHEVGHYLGLEHPFLGGCLPPTSPLCRESGDLICDTPPLAAVQYGCPSGTNSCGNPDPTENYMTYVNDACMREFTQEQARRMHCTLENWRPLLGERDYAEGAPEGDGEAGTEGEGEGEGQIEQCASTQVGDPSFEIGQFGSPWTQVSTNFPTPLCTETGCGLAAGLGPFEGQWWAWFGGASGRVEDASLEQVVTFPQATGLLLTFHLAMPQARTTGWFRVLLDGATLFEARELDASSYSGYVLTAVDISAYADGAAHTLRLEAHTDAGDGPLNFFVDGLCTLTFEVEGEGEGQLPTRHTADQNGDLDISLEELLRVIQLYSAVMLHCDGSTEDGYALGEGVRDCAPHMSDYAPQDWSISIDELLRIVQFYNSIGYVPCPEGEDLLCVVG